MGGWRLTLVIRIRGFETFEIATNKLGRRRLFGKSFTNNRNAALLGIARVLIGIACPNIMQKA